MWSRWNLLFSRKECCPNDPCLFRVSPTPRTRVLGNSCSKCSPLQKKGLVSSSYDKHYHEISKIRGNIGIGHVRYSTTASSTLKNAHPLEIEGIKGFCITHNGTIDREPLFTTRKNIGYTPPRGITDTELMGLGLYQHLKCKKIGYMPLNL